MNPILFSLKRPFHLCLGRLHSRIIRWARPLNASLLLGALADLGRSKSELMAENALLRQQLITLKRHVKRPTCTKGDRLLLVLLARMVRTWKQVLFIVQPETRLALASSGLPPLLEAKVKDVVNKREGISRDHCIDQRDGKE